jgi:hypothetical protein
MVGSGSEERDVNHSKRGAVAVAVVLLSLAACDALDGGPENAWKSLEEGGIAYAAPDGFTVHDPFTSRSKYWQGDVWLTEFLPESMSMAGFVGEEREAMIFVVRGPQDDVSKEMDLTRKLEELRGHPLVELEDEQEVTTDDGRTMKYVVGRMGEGLVAGREMTYVLALLDVGGDTIVVNAGGPSAEMDPEAIVELMRSFRIDD